MERINLSTKPNEEMKRILIYHFYINNMESINDY
jgi:hypothetical protein